MIRKLALVTGATGDIGCEVARTLSQAGYDLVLCGNKSPFNTQGINTQVSLVRFDISSAKEVEREFDKLEKQGLKFDLVVSAAGVAEKEGLIIDKSDEEISALIATDLVGTIYVNKHVLPLMKKGGVIINIASFLGEYGCSCEATYSAAKGGIIALSKSLAKEYAPFKVRVNCISPGYINTKMNAEFTPQDKRRLKAQTPLGRLGEPRDVAQAVLMLAECDFITGENIMVTGGLNI